MLLLTWQVYSQSNKRTIAKYALEINSDNDAFSPVDNKDRYYTYGAGIKFYWKPEKFLGLEQWFSKKESVFFNAEIRSEGYTPTRIEFSGLTPEEVVVNMDRPFAGLLFGTLEANYIFKNYFIKTQALLGVMGPKALSKEIQDWIHDNITEDGVIDGWYLQIPNQLIANINATAAYNFNIGPSWLDPFVMGQARFGNLYIDATPTAGFRLGKFSGIGQSAAFSNSLIAPINITEIYLISSFSVTFAAFDATAQGNIFNNDFPYAVENLNNVFTSMTHGVFITFNRFTLGYDNMFTFGQVNQEICHAFGRFTAFYRF